MKSLFPPLDNLSVSTALLGWLHVDIVQARQTQRTNYLAFAYKN